MPLIDLKTNLKSLKYGKDRPGGGDSGQPYEKVDINKIDSGFNRFRMTKFDDGLVRGGVVGAANASVVDTLRIGKFLTDFPKGPLFIAKQVGLQLSNPALETKKITIGNGQGVLGFIGNTLSTINNALGPTRIYNLGINTIAQVPLNAFGGHLNRHGLLPVQDENTKYLAVARYNNEGTGKNNRLVGYKSKFQLGDLKPNTTQNKGILNLFNNITSALNLIGIRIPSLKVDPTQLTINKYIGGPGSTYGIGNTLIKRYDFTEDGLKIQFAFNQSKAIAGKVHSIDSDNIEALDRKKDLVSGGPSSQILLKDPELLPSLSSLQTYAQISKNIKNQKTQRFGIYGDILDKNISNNFDGKLSNPQFLPQSNAYPEYFNGKSTVKINSPWNKVTREIRVGSGTQDIINLTPVFNAKAGTLGDLINIPGVGEKNIRDLVKFRIQALNGSDPTRADWMIFRAYLTQFSDNTDATWNSVKYAGRGEEFFIYSGFSRKIQIGFKVAALSEQEMKPMYQKLNYLISNLLPDYNNNLMRGPIVRMTVGNWIDGQVGILTSLSYTVPPDSPWEIALNEPLPGGSKQLILPHVIEVNLNFTPIGSQTKDDNLISKKDYSTSHIAQNINDYQYITGSIKSIK